MKKFFIFCLLFFVFWLSAKADHITGGEMYYSFAGISGDQYRYNVTAKLFMRCNSGRQFSNPNTISVFDRATGTRIRDISVPLSRSENLSLVNQNKCITNPPTVCYVVGYYDFSVLLPASSSGYILTIQVNYRINGITNLGSYNNVGATYTAEIPATPAAQNNSAQFIGSDLVVVCANNNFTYSFAAADGDGDELRYSFCSAYVTNTSGANASPPGAPPYQPVPYGPAFSGSAPLSETVQVDPKTGIITGIAPGSGVYVVTVCVEEVRNGAVIATQRKDVQINITSCTIAAASLLPEYQLCRETKTLTATNLSTSPLINTYNWEVLTSANVSLFTATSTALSYTFPDTGLYRIKLSINKNQDCSDSTTSLVRVYPGFFPAFTFNGICFTKPTAFTDATTTVYGQVNSWNWDFGEITSFSDVSDEKNTSYTYPSMGVKNAQLRVTNTNGCADTASRFITILDKPPVALAFRDTLICNRDQVQLRVNGSGQFSWAPAVNITDAQTAAPVVAPQATTTYFVTLNDNGCINTDSVKVRVTDKVALQAMNDTTICQGDAIRLRAVSDGFRFAWTPAVPLSSAAVLNPLATTTATTTYQINAFIGSCMASDQVVVTTIPYPAAHAGRDTTICHESSVRLTGSTDGTSAVWSPASSLNNPAILTPIATPAATTSYILSAFDNKGCPKPGRDTVLVTVLAPIRASAGRDTAIIVGQQLQLQATGLGTQYKWSPAGGLSATDIANPVASFNEPSNGILYKVVVSHPSGCSDSAFITVKVYATGPAIFVPTAFTPNGDGKNDRLRPIAVGIQRIEYFRIFNRWGQLVYSTAVTGPGWDGTIGGKEQGTNTFVWEARAIDFTGKPFVQKGTNTLIR